MRDAPEEAKLTRERRAPNVLDVIAEGFVAFDRDGRVLYMNPVAADYLRAWFATEPEQVLGRVLSEALPVVKDGALLRAVREAIATGESKRFEAPGVNPRRWLSCSVAPSPDGVSLFFFDITEQREAADALRASEERFRQMFDNAFDGMLLTAPDGRIFSANPAACRILGRTEEEICRLGRDALVDMADPRAIEMAAQRARHGRAEGELPMLRGDGAWIVVKVRSVVFRAAGGEARTVMSIEDITERKRLEEQQAAAMRELRASEERFRLTIDHAPIGMALVGLDGRYLRVNQRLCEMTGYSADELLARRFQDITHPDDRGRDSQITDALVRGELRHSELVKRHVTKDGAAVEVAVYVALVRGADGEPLMFIAQMQDMTERRRVEAQLALVDRMASIGTLASGIAHEINNPLAYVVINLELLREELGALSEVAPSARTHDMVAIVDEIGDGAERVRRIVRSLKTFARAEAEQRVPLDVRAVLEVALTMAEHEVKRHAAVVKEYRATPIVDADEPRLAQVFMNLLVNAAQAIPESAPHKEIRVRTSTDAKGRAVIEVSDTGVGIPEHLLGRIFDPFFTTRDVGAGTGLGLSISHSIVANLGGELTVESKVGVGSVFRVTLPASTGAHAKPKASGVAPRGRVLVVDDDTKVAETLQRVLALEHDAALATSGRAPAERIDAGERFDAIVCDLMMPEVSGAALHAHVQRVAPDQATRMIFVTGGAFTEEASAFLERVPNARLEKPFDLDALRAAVRKLVPAR